MEKLKKFWQETALVIADAVPFYFDRKTFYIHKNVEWELKNNRN